MFRFLLLKRSLNIQDRGWDVARLVKCSFSMHEALGSVLSTTQSQAQGQTFRIPGGAVSQDHPLWVWGLSELPYLKKWGDLGRRLSQQVLTVQARGPELSPQNPREKLDTVAHTCDSSTRKAETGGSWDFPAREPNQWAPSVSKNTVG